MITDPRCGESGSMTSSGDAGQITASWTGRKVSSNLLPWRTQLRKPWRDPQLYANILALVLFF